MKDVSARLVRLGGRYERAIQARDFDTAIAAEREICELAPLDENIVPQFAVVRGRNFVRRLRGQEEVSCW